MKTLIMVICFVIWGGDMVTKNLANPIVPAANVVFVAMALEIITADSTEATDVRE